MEGLIETFHLDFKLLIAQSINFAIVLAVLYFFALKPLLGVMKDRTKVIEKSLSDAKQIEEKLSKAEDQYSQKIAEARKKAEALILESETKAKERRQEIIEDAKNEIGKVIVSEKEKIVAEKAKVLKELRRDMGDLVSQSLEKILQEKIDSDSDKRLIAKTIRQIKK